MLKTGVSMVPAAAAAAAAAAVWTTADGIGFNADDEVVAAGFTCDEDADALAAGVDVDFCDDRVPDAVTFEACFTELVDRLFARLAMDGGAAAEAEEDAGGAVEVSALLSVRIESAGIGAARHLMFFNTLNSVPQ
jgi:hypothetical protein